MRCVCAVLLAINFGCASSVARIDGEFPSAVGPAVNGCEKESWLVAAPTRAEVFDDQGRRAEVRDDGVGLYRVGAKRPESIPSLADEMASYSPSFAQHRAAVRPNDTRRLTAGALGAAGIVVIAVGAALFVTAFKSESSAGAPDSEQSVDSGQAALGGVLAGVGLGLGIAGMSVNPTQAQRSKAEAQRYVFLPPRDRRDEILQATERYNQRVRERCARPR